MSESKYLIIKNKYDSFEEYFNNAFEERNYDVIRHNDFSYSDFKILTGRKTILFSVLTLKKQGYFDKYKKIIIFEDLYLSIIFSFFFKKDKWIRWMYNIISMSVAKRINIFFWLKGNTWTFDLGDAKKYGIKYNTQFYFMNKDYKVGKTLGVLFCGVDKGRFNQLKNVSNVLSDKQIPYDIKIIADETSTNLNDNLYTDKFYDYNSLIEKVKNCLAVLDIVQDGQTGLTLRSTEALCFDKKIITNNINLKNESFYSQDSIFILGEDDINKLSDFIFSDFKGYSQKDKDIYDVDAWINRFN